MLSRGEWRRQRERSSYLSRGEARLRGRGKNRDREPCAPGFFPPAIGAPERAATKRSRWQDANKRPRSASSAASGTPTTRLLPFPEILPRGRRTFYTPGFKAGTARPSLRDGYALFAAFIICVICMLASHASLSARCAWQLAHLPRNRVSDRHLTFAIS